MKELNLSELSVEQIIRLNTISEKIKNDFHSLIQDIYRPSGGQLDWLVSGLLSRDNYKSKLFLNLCLMKLIIQSTQENPELDTIILDDPSLSKTLNRLFKSRKQNIKIRLHSSPKRTIQKLKGMITPFWAIWKNLQFIFREIKWADKERKSNVPLDWELILIDTFFIPSMFRTGKFVDRYYQGVLEAFEQGERNRIYFVPTMLIGKEAKRIFSIAGESKEKFLYRHDFLKVKDYLYAFLGPFRIKRINFNNLHFENIDVSYLARSEFRKHLLNRSSLSALLNYRFIKRLKGSGIKVWHFIDWFENQLIDKGWNKGIHDYYPESHHTGYQGFIAPINYRFQLCPIEVERSYGLIPKVIGVIGKGLIAQTKQFDPELNVFSAPALRFKYLWQETLPAKTETRKLILVSLPVVFGDGLEVIQLILKTLPLLQDKEIRFHIKAHPSFDIQQLRNKLGIDWPDSFQAVEGGFWECAKQVDLMIGNASSTCFEALVLGLPVIIAGSQSGLTQNPIPESVDRRIWKLAYTPIELSKYIDQFLNLDKKQIDKLSVIGKKVKEKYFEPVTKENVRKFLKLN